MKVKIKTPDWQPLKYETEWAVWFDFKTIHDITFQPQEFKLIETWVVIQIPLWYMLQIQPRSSTFKKHWLVQVNSVWIIDQDYCWDNDTIKFAYINISDQKQFIPANTRIWQWVFVRIEKPEFEVVEKIEEKSRWWFWSTW